MYSTGTPILGTENSILQSLRVDLASAATVVIKQYEGLQTLPPMGQSGIIIDVGSMVKQEQILKDLFRKAVSVALVTFVNDPAVDGSGNRTVVTTLNAAVDIAAAALVANPGRVLSGTRQAWKSSIQRASRVVVAQLDVAALAFEAVYFEAK